MKTRTLTLLMLCCLATVLRAQPSWTKKASKSVFTLKTFAADGSLLGSCCGCFVDSEGRCISSFAPFRGAASAVVIDASGKEHAVEEMLGANDTYDVAKFRIASRKTQPLTLASTPLTQGAAVWLLPYREVKGVPTATVRRAETFNGQYAYYTLAMRQPDNTVGAPLLNEQGEVVALMQQPGSAADTLCYAVSALFADSLHTSGLSINDPTLRSVGIKKALPSDPSQALLTLYVAASTLDSAACASLISDFIEHFPDRPDGYEYSAQLAASGNNFAQADRDMQAALKTGSNADETHYTFARLIYQQRMLKPQMAYEPWTLDKAYDEAQQAYDISPLPAYRYQQAAIRYGQKRFAEAYTLYEQLFDTPMRSADLFYEASRCKEMLGDTLAQLALLDSTVAQFSRPYLKEAAPYVLARAQARMAAGKHRLATADLNDYEQLMATQVNDNFYFVRYQAELGGRLFQQALDDIGRAISMNPDNELYYAEKASLEVRVGLYAEAIATAGALIALRPQLSDGYLFLGLAQCLDGHKAEGLKNLQKAKELGDEQADELIEKYTK